MKKAQGAPAGNRNAAKQKSQSATFVDTAKNLAAEYGVHRATIIRDGQRAEFVERLAEQNPEEAGARGGVSKSQSGTCLTTGSNYPSEGVGRISTALIGIPFRHAFAFFRSCSAFETDIEKLRNKT